ncbi:MAG TPA: hypothetical protein VGO62_13505 [Myxococcota bacterium]|jgi:hypothetical protein
MSNAAANATARQERNSLAAEVTVYKRAGARGDDVGTWVGARANAPVSTLETWARATVSARVAASGGFCVLPGGFACALPEAGRVVTVAMDCGYLVHIERAATPDYSADGALVTVEPPANVAAPADDAALASLAVESRADATGDDSVDRHSASASALRRAWAYRRAFERLAEGWPGDGGPLVPVRWLTLSYEGRVHVPGVGTIDIASGDELFLAADGRRVRLRRVEHDDDSAPRGVIEVVVEAAILPAAVPPPPRSSTPRSPAIRTSSRCVLLDDR